MWAIRKYLGEVVYWRDKSRKFWLLERVMLTPLKLFDLFNYCVTTYQSSKRGTKGTA
jgi:hypothetical protein